MDQPTARQALQNASRRALPCPCEPLGELLPVAAVGHAGRRWECPECAQRWRVDLSGELVAAIT